VSGDRDLVSDEALTRAMRDLAVEVVAPSVFLERLAGG
jgi:hypothetical protein